MRILKFFCIDLKCFESKFQNSFMLLPDFFLIIDKVSCLFCRRPERIANQLKNRDQHQRSNDSRPPDSPEILPVSQVPAKPEPSLQPLVQPNPL